jgi:hypothetical protein
VAYDYMAERKALLGGGPLSALDSVAPADVAPEDVEVTVPESGLSAARAAMARRQKLQSDQQAFYDLMARQLQERRTGPSTSEQLFELSAALARPTTVRGLSGVLNNVIPVLQQQAKATREGTEGRTEALNALQMAQMKIKQGLADQDVDTELALAKLLKGSALRPVVAGPTGAMEPMTGLPVATPNPKAYADLEANPTVENLNAMAATYPRFVEPLQEAYRRGVAKFKATPSGGL